MPLISLFFGIRITMFYDDRNPQYTPSVVQAVAGPDFTVYAHFTDGTVRLADAKPLIEKGGVFARIADEEAFSELLTVMNGAVAWDVAGGRDAFGCIDLDPFTLYESSAIVADPLEDVCPLELFIVGESWACGLPLTVYLTCQFVLSYIRNLVAYGINFRI